MTEPSPERMNRLSAVGAQVVAAYRQLGITMEQATDSINAWAARMQAEAMLHSLQRHAMRDWSIEERRGFERLVRVLHESDPELSLTDCMLRVGAAIEACRRG